MNEKPVKVEIDFDEALRRIAKTPKSVVPEKQKGAKKPLVYKDLKNYNEKEAEPIPPPSRRKPT